MTTEEELERCKRKQETLAKAYRRERDARLSFTDEMASALGLHRFEGEMRRDYERRLVKAVKQ